MFFKNFFSQILFFPNFFSEKKKFPEFFFYFVVQKSFLTKIFFVVAEINLTSGVHCIIVLWIAEINPENLRSIPQRYLGFYRVVCKILICKLQNSLQNVTYSECADFASNHH